MTRTRLLGRTLAAAALTAALALPARALIGDAASAPGDLDWAGDYVGADLGYAWGSASVHFDPDGGGNAFAGEFGSGPDGEGAFDHALRRELLGLHAGMNRRVYGGFLAGVEATFLGSNVVARSENNFLGAGATNPQAGDVSYETRVQTLFALTPQVGWAWNRWLLRLKGGWAFARVSSRLANVTDGASFSQTHGHNGWTLGLAADYAVTDHWLAGLGCDYYQFSGQTYGGQDVPDITWPVQYQVRPILRALTARVSYKF